MSTQMTCVPVGKRAVSNPKGAGKNIRLQTLPRLDVWPVIRPTYGMVIQFINKLGQFYNSLTSVIHLQLANINKATLYSPRPFRFGASQ